MGDSARVTPTGGDPLRPDDGMDGVVLGKGNKYIDLCVRIADMWHVDKGRRYRLDDFVNRVSYDRMLEALQLFLCTDDVPGGPGTMDGDGGDRGEMTISRALRDLVLYSYPNSLTRLSLGGGGLRLGMPVDEGLVARRVLEGSAGLGLGIEVHAPQTKRGGSVLPLSGGGGWRGESMTESAHATVSSALEEARRRTGTGTEVGVRVDKGKGSERGVAPAHKNDNEGAGIGGEVFVVDGSFVDPFATPSDHVPAKVLAEQAAGAAMLSSLPLSEEDDDEGEEEEDERGVGAWVGIGASPYAGVFRTNERLKRMSECLLSPAQFHKRSFDDAEIERALCAVLDRGRVDIDTHLPCGWDVWSPSTRSGSSSSSSSRTPFDVAAVASEWAEGKNDGDGSGVGGGEDGVRGDGRVAVHNTSLLAFLKGVSEGDTVGGPSSGARSNHARRALVSSGGGGGGDDDRARDDTREARRSGSGQSTRGPNLMNDSQKKALFNAIQRPIALIQGPPGTGKTRTACNILSTIVQLKENRLRDGGRKAQGFKTLKMLAVAHSNVATDNMLDGLLQLGVRVVRIGRPSSVRAALWAHTLDARLQLEPTWLAAKEKVDVARQHLEAAYDAGVGDDVETANNSVKFLLRQLARVEKAAAMDVLRGADVVVSTCMGAGGELLKSFTDCEDVRFSTVLVDEAAQCVETAVLPAVVHRCDQLILVGDQNQLPPVVLSPAAADAGLGISLFARLVASGLEPSLLQTQYRMHPRIAEFASAQFYQHRLRNGVSERERERPQLAVEGEFAWPHATEPVALFDTCRVAAAHLDAGANNWDDTFALKADDASRKLEATDAASDTSYFNAVEASCVVEVVKALLAANPSMTLDDIGVISPYAAQVRHLADLFREEGIMEEVSPASASARSASGAEEEARGSGVLEVRSVDGFQGREKEVVIISTVRSNPCMQLGFLKDWRRLNVGITRARTGLVVVGDGDTLRADPHWRAFAQWCSRHGCARQLDVDALRRVGIEPSTPSILDDIDM